MGRQRESQIINPPQIGPGGRSQAKSSGWDENQTSSKAMFLKLNTQRPMGPMPHPGRTAPGPRAGFSTIFRPRSGGVTGYVTSSHRPATPLGRLPSVALRAVPVTPAADRSSRFRFHSPSTRRLSADDRLSGRFELCCRGLHGCTIPSTIQLAIAIAVELVAGACVQLPLELDHVEWRHLGL